ncbi:MAG: hypothetical protein LBD11_03655 [Candidatus Peribacteria bacterium]|jgi:hypothetical protein|nr:hypothetical protein [Candidatus Peribacteria bacterium]
MQDSTTKKTHLYNEIISACEKLTIARYLLNEVKTSLGYFHAYKLENIQKNLSTFLEYLLFLNEENSKHLQALPLSEENRKSLNHNVRYFYDHAEVVDEELAEISQKLEGNSYQAIILMQGTKGLLLLTIDEFCNASPTRMSINEFIWKEEKAKSRKRKK